MLEYKLAIGMRVDKGFKFAAPFVRVSTNLAEVIIQYRCHSNEPGRGLRRGEEKTYQTSLEGMNGITVRDFPRPPTANV